MNCQVHCWFIPGFAFTSWSEKWNSGISVWWRFIAAGISSHLFYSLWICRSAA